MTGYVIVWNGRGSLPWQVESPALMQRSNALLDAADPKNIPGIKEVAHLKNGEGHWKKLDGTGPHRGRGRPKGSKNRP